LQKDPSTENDQGKALLSVSSFNGGRSWLQKGNSGGVLHR